MTGPGSPLASGLNVSPEDLWNHLTAAGMHDDDATQAVLLHLKRVKALPARFQTDTEEQPGILAGATGMLKSATGDFLHEASLGVGEPISGAVSALQGKGFAKGASDYRNDVDALEAENPNAAALGGIAGALATPGIGGGRAATRGLKAGVGMGVKQFAGRVVRGAATGGLTGAIGGASTGGETGDERLHAALRQGMTGALLGGSVGTLAIPRVRNHLEAEADIADAGVRREGNRLRMENAKKRGQILDRKLAPPPSSEDAIRRKLTALGVPPEKIEEAVRNAAPNTAPAVENITSEPPQAVGRVVGPPQGGPAVSPERAAELDIPTYQRRAKAEAMRNDPMAKDLAASLIGQDAVPGKPELGKFTAPGKYQKAGPAVRVQSAPMAPQNIPHALSQIAKNPNDTRAVAFFVKAARDYGNSEEEIVKQLHAAGVDGGALREAMGGTAAEASGT